MLTKNHPAYQNIADIEAGLIDLYGLPDLSPSGKPIQRDAPSRTFNRAYNKAGAVAMSILEELMGKLETSCTAYLREQAQKQVFSIYKTLKGNGFSRNDFETLIVYFCPEGIRLTSWDGYAKIWTGCQQMEKDAT